MASRPARDRPARDRDKGRFYSMARGSSTECAAILDLAGRRGLADPASCAAGRALLVRIVQMLTRLEQRMGR